MGGLAGSSFGLVTGGGKENIALSSSLLRFDVVVGGLL